MYSEMQKINKKTNKKTIHRHYMSGSFAIVDITKELDEGGC